MAWRAPTSTGASRASTADRTRSSATSWPRPSWASEGTMDFDLSEDQTLLQDSVRKLLTDKYGFEQRKAFMGSEQGWSRELWAQYAELGLLGVPFAEAEGGFGGGAEEILIV